VAGSSLLSGCDTNTKPAATNPAPKAPVITEPFKYHKLIEVSPGQDYDVVSWGRGTKKAGSFEILHSDSAGQKFTTTTGDLDGAVVDAYNSDMDLDGNPEILIQAKGKDSINFTNMYAFEFTNGKANKLDFPKLTKTERQGYRGDDNFYIKDGILMREFPIYDGNTSIAKVTGAKRVFQYGLRNNSFTIKQLSKDSIAVKTTKPLASAPVSKSVVKQSETKTTKKTKKHHEEPEKKHKKKKRRRHHHSDEE